MIHTKLCINERDTPYLRARRDDVAGDAGKLPLKSYQIERDIYLRVVSTPS